MVISKNLKLGGGIHKFEGGCKHTRRANIHLKTLKNNEKLKSKKLGVGGVVTQLGGGSLTPLGGIQISLS